MALIMSLFSFIISPVEIDVLNIAGEVISSGSGSRPSVNTPVICRSYGEFELFCKSSNSKELERYLSEINRDLFDDYCVVAVNFMVPNPSYKAYVTSAEYDGKTLSLDYFLAEFRNMVTACVISYNTLILVTDKHIKKVELNKGETEKMDFFPRDSMFGCQIGTINRIDPCYVDENGCFEGCFVFEDYDSWLNFLDNGKWEISNSIEIGKNFFENSNLAVAITTHSSGGYSLYFSDCIEDGNNAEIKLFSAYEPGIHTDAVWYEAAFVAVGKDIKTADVEIEYIDLPFRVDGDLFFEIVC